MGNTQNLWMGIPLENYTKEELIEIIIQLGQLQEHMRKEHINDLLTLGGKL
jgi:hypothetical protein